jgi:hypothetical protein
MEAYYEKRFPTSPDRSKASHGASGNDIQYNHVVNNPSVVKNFSYVGSRYAENGLP